jgi:hypothetical protein
MVFKIRAEHKEEGFDRYERVPLLLQEIDEMRLEQL